MLEWLLDLLGTAGAAALLLAAAGWLARAWITERLSASVRLETDKKLAEFQKRLDAAEAEVSAVRSAGIEALHQSNAAVLAERVRATQAIWGAVVAWQRATMLSALISAFKTHEAVANAGHAPARESFRTMLHSIKHFELTEGGNAVAAWRPFISEKAWALYAALNAFYGARIAKATMMQLGKKDFVERLWQVKSELQIVKNTTTPELAALFEADEMTGSQKAVAYIESALLAELKRGLAGEESGPEAARQAAKILAVAQEATTTATVAQVEKP
jgi:hypothetical protein